MTTMSDHAIALLSPNDQRTILAAPVLRSLLPASTTVTVGVCEEFTYPFLGIKLTSPLVDDGVYEEWLTITITEDTTYGIEAHSDCVFVAASENDPLKMAELFLGLIRSHLFEVESRRARYCTGSVDDHDVLRHNVDDGACPIHPDAELDQ